MGSQQQETNRSTGVVQVSGNVHGNVVVMPTRTRSSNDHFATHTATVAECMQIYNLLKKDEVNNLLSFMHRKFNTRRFTDLSGEERHRAQRYAETLIENRKSSAKPEAPNIPRTGGRHTSQERKIAYAMIGLLSVIAVALGITIIRKFHLL